MATNFANDLLASEPQARRRLSFEHRFFLTVALIFPVIVVAGYAPTYYFKPLFNTPPLPSLLVHVHALVMTTWVLLYVVQTVLVSARRVKLHMTLGLFSIGLAGAVIVVGAMTAIAMLARGASVPGIPPAQFFVIPAVDLIVFPIIYGAAIYLRKRPADHKRLMLLTSVYFFGPAVARFPFAFVQQLGPLWFFGVPSLCAVVLLAIDTYRNGKLNRAFAAGTALMIASVPIRMALAQTAAWERFTTWLVS